MSYITNRYINAVVSLIQNKVKGNVERCDDDFNDIHYIIIRNRDFIFKTEIGDMIESYHYKLLRSIGDDNFRNQNVTDKVVSDILDQYRHHVLEQYFR